MQTQKADCNYQELNASNASLESKHQRFATILKLGRKLKAFFASVCTFSNELKIWESKNKFGQKIWTVYDPVSGSRKYFNSEPEILDWLERRYYHQ